ncbi:HlyD family secretion protein [Geofilum sp. OHC36d9]|uniref:HlyD family secretion protein n=1 Tax=Geofilum sp. OHC36d9 TaxID=3458413 RepID=UPI004033C078
MKKIDNTVWSRLLLLILVLGGFTSCGKGYPEADAYGNFEVDEVVVSAEENGRLLKFELNEGDAVTANRKLGLIDTVMLVLNRQQLDASALSVQARSMQLQKTIEVQKARLEMLQKEAQRVIQMFDAGAATQRSYDEVTGQLLVARRELAQVRSQEAALKAETALIGAKKAMLNEQLKRCRVVSPVSGTVLQKYVEAGEMVAPGKPLFKVADIHNIELRAYVSGSHLSEVTIGREVTVRYDKGKNDYGVTTGKISWISSSAEFTPKIIQTKEERVDLVYAFKVIVPNKDGVLKIGMPGEVLFDK